MIYSIILVDADSGILLLEKKLTIQKSNEVSPDALANFFGELNTVIDDIQKSMKKGRDIGNITRVVSSENSSIIMHYQPNARVLVCAIADPDDDVEKITQNLRMIGKRFWLKHRTDLEIFRKENMRDIFNSFAVDIETISLGGKIGERFPKLLIAEAALERIKMMGIINLGEYNVANLCDGKTSVFKIAKSLNISSNEAKKLLNKLEELDVVKLP